MDDNLCKCHCGTRITLDEQLLEERQSWREKYICLQKQASNDIGRLKENIYAECAALMQQEFTVKQAETNQLINAKNAQIKSLTSRVINLQARIKILEKQKEILTSRSKQMEIDISDKERLLQNFRSHQNKSERDWQVKIEEEVTLVRKRISQQFEEKIKNLEAQNQHLMHKVRQFQKKYQIIIPEVEKLKQNLANKTEQLEQLEIKFEKNKKEYEQKVEKANLEVQQLETMHSKCKGTISKLSEKVSILSQQLQTSRKVKKEVKVEPVYIERPVEVQKIVEKIVEVERIVNKYIEPTTFRDEKLQSQVVELKKQIDCLDKQILMHEEKHRFMIHQYEEAIKQYQDNEVKYKKERDSLVKTIEDQHKEIDMIQTMLERRNVEPRYQEPERITVHVNKDGTYHKTVGKAANYQSTNNGYNNSGNMNNNVRVSKKR